MSYGPSLAMWQSKAYRTRKKAQRVFKRIRARFGFACGSRRRPYSRPALSKQQRRVQLQISRRRG